MIRHQESKRTLCARRVRHRLRTTSQRPRLHVFRSNRFLYAQIIDDIHGKTLVGVAESALTAKTGTKTQRASALGDLLGKQAKNKKITQVRFDRGPYRYHGRIKALAEAARAAGLDF